MNDDSFYDPPVFEDYHAQIISLAKIFYHSLTKKLQYELELDDIIQNGCLLYYEAVKSYDPTRAMFSTHLQRFLDKRFLNLIRNLKFQCRDIEKKVTQNEFDTRTWRMLLVHIGRYDIAFRRIELRDELTVIATDNADEDLRFLASRILAGHRQRANSDQAARLSAALR